MCVCVRACVRACVRVCILHIVMLEPLLMSTLCVSLCVSREVVSVSRELGLENFIVPGLWFRFSQTCLVQSNQCLQNCKASFTCTGYETRKNEWRFAYGAYKLLRHHTKTSVFTAPEANLHTPFHMYDKQTTSR